jgi:glucoamylase
MRSKDFRSAGRETRMSVQENVAFGRPGIEPRWSHGDKGRHSVRDRQPVWFTLWNGIVTEVYYPTVDRPQLRGLRYLISDG